MPLPPNAFPGIHDPIRRVNMEGSKKIEILFTPEEARFCDMIEQHCGKNNVGVSDYIKELVKRDLGWGQFMKPKKPSR
jgi:hypothetical protein